LLALEEVYDVIIVKDGQEAYDTVKSNMEKGDVFDLIFMDIQVEFSPSGDVLSSIILTI
jgi:osomolarity two-component system sensor histidine kinase SLN1